MRSDYLDIHGLINQIIESHGMEGLDELQKEYPSSYIFWREEYDGLIIFWFEQGILVPLLLMMAAKYVEICIGQYGIIKNLIGKEPISDKKVPLRVLTSRVMLS
ncbi:MAG TPA: hypothetical protein VIE65_11165 [Methylobacter sp.]|jgi:hypothetical protein